MKLGAAKRLRRTEAAAGTCAVRCVDERKVAVVCGELPSAEEIERIAERFAALSDPTRVRILLALSHEELCVCDLSRVAERSMPATSQQLQLLRRLGLVKYRTDGKLAYYRLADPWVRRALETALADMAGGGR